ncbi:COP23 domain-containing protein [Pelatocladus sp. BLCC-F211]|uniref:COP23 domain-containing protein n=1 Tax=Pelatocladus sp. BLCC-F211 TaxID=3342752 RepID=UPI0035BB563E
MNKCLYWVTTLGMSTILASPALAVVAQPSKVAYTMKVTCKTDTATPTVVASFSEQKNVKDLTILSFLPEYFSSQAAVQNCEKTAKTLQALYQTGRAKYLTNDKSNAQPVICAVERRGIGCNHYSAQVLFALDEKVNSSQALYQMLGSDFKQSQPPDSRTVGKMYTDIKPSWWPWK